MQSETRMGDRSPGALMWLLVVLVGLAMLSNVFIAVISENYTELRPQMNDRWREQVNEIMREHLWRCVAEAHNTVPPALTTAPVHSSHCGVSHCVWGRCVVSESKGTHALDELFDLLSDELRDPSRYRFERRSNPFTRWLFDTTRDVFSMAILGERATKVALAHGVLAADGTPSAGDESDEWLREVEAHHKPATSGAAAGAGVDDPDVGWYARTGIVLSSGGASSREPDGYAPCDMRWYDDEAVALRFRFSWVAMPRFDDEACKLELLSEAEAHTRQYERDQQASRTQLKNIEEMLGKGAGASAGAPSE